MTCQDEGAFPIRSGTEMFSTLRINTADESSSFPVTIFKSQYIPGMR